VSLPSEAGTEDWLTNLSRALILPTCGAKISLTKDEMSFRSSWENATAAVPARSHERTRRVRPARTTTTRARASPTPSSGSRGDRVHGDVATHSRSWPVRRSSEGICARSGLTEKQIPCALYRSTYHFMYRKVTQHDFTSPPLYTSRRHSSHML
jgi:hypothetical protein